MSKSHSDQDTLFQYDNVVHLIVTFYPTLIFYILVDKKAAVDINLCVCQSSGAFVASLAQWSVFF